MRRVTWLGALATAVGALLLSLVVSPAVLTNLVLDRGPTFIQDYPPPTDLPQTLGYRTMWAAPSPVEQAVRPGDVLLELVRPGSTPFAPHYSEPLYQAAYIARRCVAAVVVTSDRATDTTEPLTFVEASRGRVDQVLVDHGDPPIAPGSFLWVTAHGGTRVSRVGGTQVVERLDYVRVPRAGGRYLLFIGVRGYGETRSAQLDYGNAFEVRGRGLVSMRIPDSGAWRQSSNFERVRALVRRRGTMPPPLPGDWEAKEDLLR